MSDYGFFAGYLRFVAAKTAKDDGDIAAMMATLEDIAQQLETGASIEVARDNLAVTGRGLAGFAGFLQQQILPEAVASGHAAVEKQLRWAIDTAMEMMTRCMTHAEITEADETLVLTLPPPPKQ